MQNRKLILVAALMVSACVQAPVMIWVNPHKNDAQFKADRFECLKVSDAATPPAVATAQDAFGPYQYDVNDANRDQLFGACMNAKGWTFQAATPVPMVQQ